MVYRYKLGHTVEHNYCYKPDIVTQLYRPDIVEHKITCIANLTHTCTEQTQKNKMNVNLMQ